ncbi:DUF2127 domain-containing protein [Pseudoxanthomonas dokdonensis]|uniref:Membrane protein n=1 Tax=Pseudoxanthomonas dokdonensis TaxID=344882 RepID=A0A0R0CP26_9GAMM|nr:DUF2127 domain-containing protein [Pseudoxanthomonas dokdonensis]KRG68146.1 membrane protein [Pseudoxanthomonas dokdonensis]
MTAMQYNPDPHAHPGLHLIAVFEAFKGVLAVAAATGLAVLGPQPLRTWLEELIQRFHLDTRHGLLPDLLNAISPGAVQLVVVIGIVYALIRFFEAWGLWRARAWASWLGCIGSAIYLPFDIYAIYRHPGWHTWAVLIINLVVVAALGRDLLKRRRI